MFISMNSVLRVTFVNQWGCILQCLKLKYHICDEVISLITLKWAIYVYFIQIDILHVSK